MNRKRYCTALSLLLTSLCVHAEEEVQTCKLENRIAALEAMDPTTGMINPPARPFIKTSADVNVYGQLLLMKPEQGGMEFAVHMANPLVGRSTTALFAPVTSGNGGPQTGSVVTTDLEWDWGLRIGMGYNMVHDGWDVNTAWFRFHSAHQGTNVRHNRDPLHYVPLIVPPLSGQNNNLLGGTTTVGGTVTQTGALLLSDWVTQRWRLNVDMADLELGREFYVSKWLTLRPFVGPRAAWINQNMVPKFFGGSYVSQFDGTASQTTPHVTSGPLSVVSIVLSNRFWGCGPRLGLNTLWGLGGGFSFYGNTDLSILWGRFRVRNQIYVKQQSSATALTGTVTKILDVYNNHQTRRPIANITFGVRWDHTFGTECNYAMGAVLGYEHNLFWQQNQEMKFDHANSFGLNAANDNLSLAGLHLGATFDF